MDINHKRIVLTGAGSGIGKELLSQLQSFTGVKILAADLKIEGIPSNDQVIPIQSDTSDETNLRHLIKEAERLIGGIDIFIANAGFAYYERIQKSDWMRIDKIYKTNVYSPIFTVCELNRTLQNPFLFVVTASAMSHLALPGYAIYSSTKAAVHSFMSAYRYEMKHDSKIMVVYPIATRTQFFNAAGEKVPIPFPSQAASTVAKKIVNGIRSDAESVYPSLIFQLTRFFDRFLFFPFKIYQWIESKKLEKL
ncbi:KR domain protein [Leptospira ryugenii]|uniref:KR domain protein n=1 Tax=Leptospira ryugenii TaxID=1917863 RepID=A0A2P2DVG9_9LEPT|nr:SDR family NAD(P)-dependent oxidoreductase [Leptospira ryugenii]GBF48636.1 KR domain protein [Leptospira ryugenii]